MGLIAVPGFGLEMAVREAQLNELQNKLGFLTSPAQVAEASGLTSTTNQLKNGRRYLSKRGYYAKSALDSKPGGATAAIRRSKEAEYLVC